MKNPNGFGTVYKLTDKKRRRPWAVRVTDTWEICGDKLKRKYKYIGYYETRKEAMQALSKYNTDPSAVTKDILFADLYKMWSEEKFPVFSKSTAAAYRSAFKICKPLYGCSFKDLRRPQLQRVINESGKGYQTLAHVKAMLSNMYKFAIENDICDKDYAQFIDLTKFSKQDKAGKVEKHTIFTKDEILTLEAHSDDDAAAVTLIMIYSGVRISELLDLKLSNVHLDERWFYVEKSKTAAGVRRVPIADKAAPLFARFIADNESGYLLSNGSKKYTYGTFIKHIWSGLRDYGMEHIPHDTRHTCITRLAEEKVDPTIIKKIVGHTGAMSVTEKVYTHYDIKPLLDAVNKI